MIKINAFYLHLVSVSSTKACEVEQWHVNFRNECITGLETPAGIISNQMKWIYWQITPAICQDQT